MNLYKIRIDQMKLNNELECNFVRGNFEHMNNDVNYEEMKLKKK